MPLLNELKTLSEPGNPDGVCAVASAVTAHALMTGPESLTGLAMVTLPIVHHEELYQVDINALKRGDDGPGGELDVSRIEGGKAKVWQWKEGAGSDIEGGVSMITWLKETAPPGVYAGCVDTVKGGDEHYFNIAKTEGGQVYLVDSSMQNYLKIKGTEDLYTDVIEMREHPDSDEESVGQEVGSSHGQVDLATLPKVPLVTRYCSGNMYLDYCGALHPGCAQELQQTLKRSVRQDFQAGIQGLAGGHKHGIS